MPIYEYQCEACGEHMEVFQKVSDPDPKQCPTCGKNKLSRIVSAPSFQLKGEGWYVTDFRDKGKPKPKQESPKKEEAKKETVKSEKKTEE